MNKVESKPQALNPPSSNEAGKKSLFKLLKRKKPEEETVPCLLRLRKISRAPGAISYAGCVYQGELNDQGVPNGSGSIRGLYSSYCGHVLNGIRQGKGVLCAGREVYEGDFADDQYHGHGKLTIANTGVYEGAFQKGKFEGKGKFTWNDGTAYEGDFSDDCSHGKGVLRFVDGKIYVGDFLKNFPHGKGTLSFPGGLECRGDFCLGAFHGYGRIFYPNGDIYEGQVENGKRQGEGRLISLSTPFSGIWKDDLPFTGVKA